MRLLVALLLVVLGQESDPAALVRQLRSEDLSERERAVEALKKLGDAAVAELEKHARDADPDVAAHVGRLLAASKIRKTLTPRMLAARPGIEHRLAADPSQWVVEYCGTYAVGPGDLHPELLMPEDTEALAVEAVKFARDPETRVAVLHVAGRRGHTVILPHLPDPAAAGDTEAQRAAPALQMLRDPAAIPMLLGLIRRPRLNGFAINGLSAFRADAVGPALAAAFPAGGKPDEIGSWLTVAQRLPSRHVSGPLRAIVADRRSDFRETALQLLLAVDPDAAFAVARDALGDSDPAVRGAAVRTLGASPRAADRAEAMKLAADRAFHVRTAVLDLRLQREPDRRSDLLREALADADPAVVEAALSHLRFDAGSGELELARPLLSHRSPSVRRSALEVLRDAHHEAAGPAAAALLADPDEDTRAVAVEALVNSRWRPAAEAAARRIAETKDLDERLELAGYFGRICAEELPPAVMDLLDEEADLRDQVVSWMERLRPRGSVAALTARLKAEASREAAARVLASIPVPAAVEALRPLAADESAPVRRAVALALRRWGGPGDLDALRKLFKDADPETRLEALRGILRLDPKPTEALKDALGDAAEIRIVAIPGALAQADADLAVAAVRATGLEDSGDVPLDPLLSRRRPEDVVPLLEKAWQDATPAVRRAVLDLISRTRLAAARGLLDKAESSEDPALAVEGLVARAAIDPAAAVPRIAAIMRRGPHGHRLWCALFEIRDPAAAPVLEQLLDAADPAVQVAGLRALDSMGRPARPEKLRPFLKSRYARLRATALESIGSSADRETAAAVVELLGDPSLDVIKAAVDAAGRLRLAPAAPALARLRAHARIDIASSALAAWLDLARIEDVAAYLRSEARADPLFLAIDRLPAGAEVDAALREAAAGPAEAARRFEELLMVRSPADRTAIFGRWIGDPDPWRRHEALAWARSHGGADLLPEIRHRLKDPSSLVREMAIQAVTDLEGPKGWKWIAPLTSDAHAGVRLAAVTALARMHLPETAGVLEARLDDPWAHVRGQAATGLVQLGRRDAAWLALGRTGAAVVEVGFAARFMEDEYTEPNALNALRDPETYRRVTVWTLPTAETLRQRLDRIGREAGRPMDPPAFSSGVLDEACSTTSPGPLLEMLRDETLEEAIRIDPDRIRYLPVEEAVEFWHRWLMGIEK